MKRPKTVFIALLLFFAVSSCEKDPKTKPAEPSKGPERKEFSVQGTVTYEGNPVSFASYGSLNYLNYLTDSEGNFTQSIYLDFHNPNNNFLFYAAKDTLAGYASFSASNNYKNTIQLKRAGNLNLVFRDTSHRAYNLELLDLANMNQFVTLSLKRDTTLLFSLPENEYRMEMDLYPNQIIETFQIGPRDTVTRIFTF